MDISMGISMDIPMDTYSLSIWLTCKIANTIPQSTTGVGRHIKTTMTQAFLSEIVIQMHKSK